MFLFTIGLAGSQPLGPLAIGSMLMVMVFAGGHLSGANYNPAITLALRLCGRDKITTKRAFAYVALQLFGGFLGALTAAGLHSRHSPPLAGPHTGDGYEPAQAFGAELLFTMILAHVVLNVATVQATADNHFYGLSIGFAVTVGAVSVGRISGGAFNPAVAFGLSMAAAVFDSTNSNAGHIDEMWIYWVGPMMGASIAACLFYVANGKDYLLHYKAKKPEFSLETL